MAHIDLIYFQILPLCIKCTVLRDTPKSLDIAVCDSPLANRVFITTTWSRRSLALCDASPLNTGNNPKDLALRIFSKPVTYSRLSTRLLSLFPSMWSTCLSIGREPMNAAATKPCITLVDLVPLFLRFAEGYPFVFRHCLHNRYPRLTTPTPLFLYVIGVVRNLPKLLTSYLPSYPTTSFQISSMFNSFSENVQLILSDDNTRVSIWPR